MAEGTGHHVHTDTGHNHQNPAAEVEQLNAKHSADIERLKTEYERLRNLIKARLRNGYQIPQEYIEVWSQITGYRDFPSTSVGLFSGSPVVAHQSIARSSKPKKKNITRSVPCPNGNKVSAIQCVNPVTRKQNQQEVNGHVSSVAEAVPAFDVSQNGLKTAGTRYSQDINDLMECVKCTQPCNVFSPVSSTSMTSASDNGLYLMTPGLENSQQLHLQQQTQGTIALGYPGDAANKATQYCEANAHGQVLNDNNQWHPCSCSPQASGQYTLYKAAHSAPAPDNRVSQQLHHLSMQMVSTDTHSEDTILPNNGFLVGLPGCYTNHQQNDLHQSKQAIIICMPTATEPTTLGSDTYLPTSGQRLNNPQPQQQYPPMTSMHRERCGLVTPNDRMFTRNQAIFNKSQQQNLQHVSRINNAPTSRQAVSTTAAPCCGESTSRQAASTKAVPCCGESVPFFASRTNSQHPVLQHSAQKAQMSSLSMLESGIATSSRHYAQKAQCAGVSEQGPGIETSSQHSSQEPRLSIISVHESVLETSNQAVNNQLPQTPLQQMYPSPPEEFQPTVQPSFLSTTSPQNMQAVVIGRSISVASSTSSPSHHMTLASHNTGGSAGSYSCNDHISEISAPSFLDNLLDDYFQ